MWHEYTEDGIEFVHALVAMDLAVAEDAQRRGCPCGGRLHRADYPRKVRGVPREHAQAFARRISLCCERDGCRRRITPPSVRFLGRRVYAAAIVIAAAGGWLTGQTTDAPRRTVRRWRAWFRAGFARSRRWRATRARFVPPPAEDALPGSLLDRLSGTRSCRLLAALRLVVGLVAPPPTPPTPAVWSRSARDG